MTPINIAVMSFAGSVGKTLATNYLMAPRLLTARILSVETVSQDASVLGTEVTKFGATESRDVYSELMAPVNTVIDVGGAEVLNQFLMNMQKVKNGLSLFDIVIIPVTPNQKDYELGFETADKLIAAGFDKSKIRFLPNRISVHPENELEAIYGFSASRKLVKPNPNVWIEDSELFAYLRATGKKFSDFEGRNFRAEVIDAYNKGEGDTEATRDLQEMAGWAAVAASVSDNMDRCYQALFPGH